MAIPACQLSCRLRRPGAHDRGPGASGMGAFLYRGGSWSALVELKKDHQLIRRGPYAIVRHPIYSGLMLATLGTAVMQGELHGLLALALIVTEPLANSQINVSTRPSLNAVNARRAPLV